VSRSIRGGTVEWKVSTGNSAFLSASSSSFCKSSESELIRLPQVFSLLTNCCDFSRISHFPGIEITLAASRLYFEE